MSDFKKFKLFINKKCVEWEISIENIYFSQTRDGYYANYKPNYPEKSNADFTVFEDLITSKKVIYGNSESLIPTITELY